MGDNEIARLKDQILQNYRAAYQVLASPLRLVFESPSITAPHNFITARMEKISDCQTQLVDLVGADTATRITAQAISEAAEGDIEETGKDQKS